VVESDLLAGGEKLDALHQIQYDFGDGTTAGLARP